MRIVGAARRARAPRIFICSGQTPLVDDDRSGIAPRSERSEFASTTACNCGGSWGSIVNARVISTANYGKRNSPETNIVVGLTLSFPSSYSSLLLHQHAALNPDVTSRKRFYDRVRVTIATVMPRAFESRQCRPPRSISSSNLSTENNAPYAEAVSPSSLLSSFRSGNRHFIGVQIACKSHSQLTAATLVFSVSPHLLRPSLRLLLVQSSSINDIHADVSNRVEVVTGDIWDAPHFETFLLNDEFFPLFGDKRSTMRVIASLAF